MAAAMGQGRKTLKEFGQTNSLLQAKKDRDAEDVMAKIGHSSMFAGVNDSEEAKEKVYEFFEKKNTKLEFTKDWQGYKNQMQRDNEGAVLDGAQARDRETSRVKTSEKIGILFNSLLGKKEKDEKLWGSGPKREVESTHVRGDTSDLYTPYGNEHAPPPIMMASQGEARGYVMQYVEAPYDPINEDDDVGLGVPETSLRAKSLQATQSLRASTITRSPSVNRTGSAGSLARMSSLKPSSGSFRRAGSLAGTASLARTASSGTLPRTESGTSGGAESCGDEDYFSQGEEEEQTQGIMSKINEALSIKPGVCHQPTKYKRTGTGKLVREPSIKSAAATPARGMSRSSSVRAFEGGDGLRQPSPGRGRSKSPGRARGGKPALMAGDEEDDGQDLYRMWGLDGVTPATPEAAATPSRMSGTPGSLIKRGSFRPSATPSPSTQASVGSSPYTTGLEMGPSASKGPAWNHFQGEDKEEEEELAPVAPPRRSRTST